MNRFFAWGLVLALAGCGDDDGPMTVDGGRDGGIAIDDGAMPDATTEDAGGPMGLCPAGDALLDPVSGTPRFVVVGSDYTSSVVSLLAADGTVLSDAWIDSGTTAPGLVSTLSGDVAVAAKNVGGTVSLIDRFMTDVVSVWCLDGSLVGQLRVRPSEGSFSSNPQDAVLSDDEAWVSRFEQNPDGAAMAGDRGSDLLGFEPSTMTTNGRRIDLAEYGGTVMGRDGEGAEVSVAVLARPSSVVPVGDRLVVGLGLLPADLFGTSRGAGTGEVVLADPADLSTTSIELEGLKNCGGVQAVPGTTDEVLVACGGYSDVSFSDAAGVRATAGFVRLRVTETGFEVVRRWNASTSAESLVAISSAVALGGDRVLGVAAGDFATVGDRLVLTNLETGAQTTVLSVDGSYVLGTGALVGDVLLVPDASEDAPAVRRFTVGETLVEGEAIEVGPATLPPRVISAI